MNELDDATAPREAISPHEPSHTASGHSTVGRRRRAFVAAPSPMIDNSPVPPPALSEDDDLPVLTEVVSVEAAVSEQKTEHLDEAQISLLASVITHAIEQQLANDLPGLLESALREASESLRAGIAVSMENALHDVLSRYK